jgi:hypothetical protein
LLMLILMGLLTAGLGCLAAWTTWQMWRTNMPQAQAKNPSRYRAVLTGFGVFYLAVAAAGIAFGWAALVAAGAVSLAIAVLLHLATLTSVPRRIRTASERGPPGGQRDRT